MMGEEASVRFSSRELLGRSNEAARGLLLAAHREDVILPGSVTVTRPGAVQALSRSCLVALSLEEFRAETREGGFV